MVRGTAPGPHAPTTEIFATAQNSIDVKNHSCTTRTACACLRPHRGCRHELPPKRLGQGVTKASRRDRGGLTKKLRRRIAGVLRHVGTHTRVWEQHVMAAQAACWLLLPWLVVVVLLVVVQEWPAAALHLSRHHPGCRRCIDVRPLLQRCCRRRGRHVSGAVRLRRFYVPDARPGRLLVLLCLQLFVWAACRQPPAGEKATARTAHVAHVDAEPPGCAVRARLKGSVCPC